MSKNIKNTMEVYTRRATTTINGVTLSLMQTETSSFIHLNCKESNHYSIQHTTGLDVCFESTAPIVYSKHIERVNKTREYVKMSNDKKLFETNNPWLKTIR